jgi:hypothetical protein
VFAARYELNSYIVCRKRLVSKRLSKVAGYVTDPHFQASSCKFASSCAYGSVGDKSCV